MIMNIAKVVNEESEAKKELEMCKIVCEDVEFEKRLIDRDAMDLLKSKELKSF